MPQLIPAIISFGVQAATASALGAIGSGLAGAIAGGLVASMLQPKQRSEGPRLSDLRVQSSSYGTIIPYALGGPRLAGQVIWSPAKRETKTVTSSGGKGGGGQENTSYTYKTDLLILLTSNVQTGISRVWMNGGLIWNKSTTADAATILASDSIPQWTSLTFYGGGATQGVDPIYEAAVGTANCPANRGRCTVMLADVNLGSSGSIPNFEFELQDTTVITLGTEVIASNVIINHTSVRVEDDRAICMFQNSGTTIWGRVLREAGISSSGPVSGNNATASSIVALTSTKFLAIWNENAGGATPIRTEIITTIGSPATSITTGAEYLVETLSGVGGGRPFLGFISATQVLAVWSSFTSGTLKATVLTISGTVVTIGTIYSLVTGLTADIQAFAMLTPTNAVAALQTNTAALYTMAISVSGSVVTLGAPIATTGASSLNYAIAMVPVSATTALAVYQHGTTELRSLIVSITGSASGPITVYTEYVQFVDIVALSTSKFLCVWHQNPSNLIKALPMSSGGTASGAIVSVAPGNPGERPRAVALSSTKAMVVWRDMAPFGQLTYNTLTVN